ncbi:MAG: glycosyltransferase family 4 protein [Rhodobacteraceae bacterium]|nr:glycosyltransferase family 4 protein [Paracoccaceae bacterium]
MPELFVTNFNRNFTGVSATAANVIRQQVKTHDLALIGHPLPGCPDPIPLASARALSRTPPGGREFVIWHVRRNPEMRAAIWARDVWRLPVRIVFTSAALRYHSAYPRWLISRMDAVIATTEHAAKFVPHVRAVVAHGVDTDLFCPSPDRSGDWIRQGYGGLRGIATIGRIRPEKGSDLFVETMLRLLPRHPDCVALLIGKATAKHQKFLQGLKDQVRAAGLADRLLFPGELPPGELPALMRALSLVIQLPRYEGYGMVPLEGMASAVPFIASNAGYYQAFSAQGKAGVIVAQEAPRQAATAAHVLLSDARRLAAMGTSARDIAHRSFSAAIEAAAIDAVYQQLQP